MAKSENVAKKQRKNKKRRHEESHNADDSDEIADKSFIIESPIIESKTKSAKTDSKEVRAKKHSLPAGGIKAKRIKTTISDDDNDDNFDENLPNLEQLIESEKPENVSAVITVRQKKKLRHQQWLKSLKDNSIDKEIKRNEEYLLKWRNSRGEWKFEKLRQISIQRLMFDETKMSNKIWPIALEYLSGSNGAAKQKIIQLAEEVIGELDKECDELEDEVKRQSIVESVSYQRARDLLQSLS